MVLGLTIFLGFYFTFYFTYDRLNRRESVMAQPQPLSGPPPKEIPLPRAPLARVIAQVNFPEILAIRNPDKVAAFQEAIRTTYPVLNQERVNEIVVQPNVAPEVRTGLIWRFQDRETQPQWRASLAVGYVALETTAYLSRSDFLDRLRGIVASAESAFKPAETKRIGIRHINRLTDEAVDRIEALIQPKVLGIIGPDREPPTSLRGSIIHLVTEAQLLAEEGNIQARWGSLPANATIDPAALEPINKPSWVIDLDMFSTTPQPFISAELHATSVRFAERIYSVFREMVTDEFLRFYGGQI